MKITKYCIKSTNDLYVCGNDKFDFDKGFDLSYISLFDTFDEAKDVLLEINKDYGNFGSNCMKIVGLEIEVKKFKPKKPHILFDLRGKDV